LTEHQKIHQLISTRPSTRIFSTQRLHTATKQELLDHCGIQATSLPTNFIGDFWKSLSPYFQYDCPPDYPVDTPLAGEPSALPRRFLFVPNASGVQFIGSLIHQQQVEPSRFFTFQAHVLFNKKTPQISEPAWTASEAMQLFNWDWNDRQSNVSDMETLDTLPTDLPQAVDNHLIHLFISTEKSADFDAAPNGHLIPMRWRAMTAKVRRNHLRKALRCAMESCVAKPRSALIVCEPEIAIVLFYCIARLIPSTLLADASFSTFEPNFHKRLRIQIAATSFHKPNAITFDKHVTSEVLKRQFVVNTFNGPCSPEIQSSQFISYANHTINLLKSHGWSHVNSLLQVFTSLKPKSAKNIRQLIVGEGTFQALVDEGTRDIPTKFIDTAKPLVKECVRLRMVEYFLATPSSTALAEICADEIKHELFFHLLAHTDSYATVHEIVDPSISGTKLALANKIISYSERHKYDPFFLAKMIAWRFLNTKEPLSILSQLLEQQLGQELDSSANTDVPLLTRVITLMDSCTSVFDEKFVRGLDNDDSQIALLFGLLAQDSDEQDMRRLQENHYLWLSNAAQDRFVRLCTLDKLPDSFAAFMAIEIANQIDPYTNPQSIFHCSEGFSERVKTFLKCKSILGQQAQVHLEQARNLVGLFQETVQYRSSTGLLGASPFPKLLVHLKTIYTPAIKKDSATRLQDEQLRCAVKSAAAMLNGLNSTNKSLDSILMIKWDIHLYDHFHSESTCLESQPAVKPIEISPTDARKQL
jgi:hypothetical protein